jgi:hypothetical protein
MDSLPVPAASLVSVDDAPLAKRAKVNQLPCSFFCITEDEGNPKIVGLFHASSVRHYSDSSDTTPQFLNLIASGTSVDKANYVAWDIDSVLPLSEAFDISEDKSIAVDIRRLKVLKALTAAGYQELLLKHVEVGGNKLALARVVPRNWQIRCFKMSSQSWRNICTAGLKSLVTTRVHLVQAGLPASDMQLASQDSEPRYFTAHAAADSQTESASACGSMQHIDGNSDSDGEQQTDIDTSRHSIDTILSCIRLSVLLRNASNLKEAIAASLAAFKSASKARAS